MSFFSEADPKIVKRIPEKYEAIGAFGPDNRTVFTDRSLRRNLWWRHNIGPSTFNYPNFNCAIFSHRAADLDVGRTTVIHGQRL